MSKSQTTQSSRQASKPQSKIPNPAVKNSSHSQTPCNVGVYTCAASAGKGWTGGKYKGL